MLRRVKKWWADNALLFIVRAVMSVLYPLFWLKEIMAPPEKQARMRVARRKFEETRRRAKDIKAQVRRIQGTSPLERSLKRLELSEKYLQENGSPESLASVREARRNLFSVKNEHTIIDAIRADAGDDEMRLVDSLRNYLTEHPESSLGEASLMGALRKAGRYNEAIAIARERLPRIRQQESESDIRTFTASTSLAVLLTESGEPGEAIFLLEKLLTERPECEDVSRVMVWKTLAEAYEKAGNCEEAQKNWKRVASYSEYKELSKMAKERLRALA